MTSLLKCSSASLPSPRRNRARAPKWSGFYQNPRPVKSLARIRRLGLL